MFILSIFPGIDLLGRGFEAEGHCIVRGPDLLWGGDIRSFHPPEFYFDGIIGGSPCQDFSKKRRTPPTGYGLEMLHEFIRIVNEASPAWFLLENVPTVPDIEVPGYTIQRLDLNALECGSVQRRLRHFQFGSHLGLTLMPARATPPATQSQPLGESARGEPTALATEGKYASRRAWPDFCELQGLPRDFDLPGMPTAARYAAVGNGVHIAVARTLARAIVEAYTRTQPIRVCGCNCGRPVTGKQSYAIPACRKRMERRRKGTRDIVTSPAA